MKRSPGAIDLSRLPDIPEVAVHPASNRGRNTSNGYEAMEVEETRSGPDRWPPISDESEDLTADDSLPSTPATHEDAASWTDAESTETGQPAPRKHLRTLSELIDPTQLTGDNAAVRSPSGNVLGRKSFMARKDRPLSLPERQQNIRQRLDSNPNSNTTHTAKAQTHSATRSELKGGAQVEKRKKTPRYEHVPEEWDPKCGCF